MGEMFKNILVPLDGSDLAERGLSYAKTLVPAGGRLILIRVARNHWHPGIDAAEQWDVVHGAEAMMAQRTERLEATIPGVEWHVYYGSPAEGIVKEARLTNADLIVMSTHARSGLDRLVHGSITEQVLRDAKTAVLVVSLRCQRAWPPAVGDELLVPLDGSDVAEAALRPAIDLAQRFNVTLRLLTVVEPLVPYTSPGFYPPFELQADADNAAKCLAAVADRIERLKVPAVVEVAIGRPQTVIKAVAAREQTAGIVMATHSRHGWRHLVLGSVAEAVLQDATVPMLIVHPEIPAEAPAKAAVAASQRQWSLAAV